MAVSFCRSCNAPISASAQFCDQCGADQTTSTSTASQGAMKSIISEIDRSISSATQPPAGVRSSGEQVEVCPECGAQVNGDWYRCPRCGRQLREDVPRGQRPLTVSDIALGVFIGMMAYSVVGAVIWWFVVYAVMKE